MRSRRISRVAAVTGVIVVALAGASVARAAFTPGAAGGGDPFLPPRGNGGYDVTHYSLTLDYSPARYPFDAVGAIVDDAKVVGYSLETQTKPFFDRMPNE